MQNIIRHGSRLPSRSGRFLGVGLVAAALSMGAHAQQLLHQEGFNTDGTKTSPPRYTVIGGGIYEVPRIQAELSNYDQKGPIYFAHNFDVSFVGNPNIPGRRMILTWRGADTSTASEDLLKVLDSSINWLLNGKANARVVVNPNAASIQGLADRLVSKGHTVEDDDTAANPDEQDVVADLLIHGPGANNPSRFAMVPKPVIVINNPDFDDMLVGSIGSSATFTPGQVTIAAPGHPAAGGKTGSFDAFTADQTFDLVGSFLPVGATTVATVTRTIPPAVNNLQDVDAMIAGSKQHSMTPGTVADLDLADGSAGSWPYDNPLPGGYAGNWGARLQGKLFVSSPGTYRFAVGCDDGARFQIDVDRNGFSQADVVTDDPGPHGHQIVYADVTFPAAGAYDYNVISYNSGGGGSLEVSVAVVQAPVPDDALDSGWWEVLGTSSSGAVRLQAPANVTGYVAAGSTVEVQTPLIVLLNGPNDTPKGQFYDGGAFSGFEGSGFFGASGLNKWPYPDGRSYRAVQLRPVNVAGKSNVKVTLALAATQVDFETSDYVQVLAYPNGLSSTPTTLANFRGVVNAFQPWLADEKENFVRRLTKQFTDFTFDVPPGATDLVVEIRVATTWWTETAAFDNVRITSGVPVQPQVTAISSSGGQVTVTWQGGTLQSKPALDGAGTGWTDINNTGSYSEPASAGAKFFRVRQ
jgi:hypothetical protein